MHLGLIGGIGPAATEFYYRGLVSAWPESAGPLELTIAHADLTTLRRNVDTLDRDAQARVFKRHLDQLAGAGVDVAAVTSVGGHFCIQELEAISPLPLLNALTAIGDELHALGIGKVGLLGTVAAMESRLYGAVGGVDIVMPTGDELGRVGATYVAIAVSQTATREQRDLLFAAGRRMSREQGAEAILLAGTDLFLAFEGEDPGFKVLDCAEMHIRALVATAT